MAVFLSYKILKVNPAYGKSKAAIGIRPLKSLRAGDSCNTYLLNIKNHLGTHIDCPRHFFANGAAAADYKPEFWVFRHPQVIPVKARPGELIGEKDLKARINRKADILLFRSGWSKNRGKDIYATANPGLEPSLGASIRDAFPSVRAIGIDWISISSYKHRDIGRKTHRIFLNPKGKGHPVLIIEDMYIPAKTDFKTIIVSPLRIKGIDSAPCTIIGF